MSREDEMYAKIASQNGSVVRHVVVNNDDYSVRRGGVVFFMRQGWLVEDMFRLTEACQGIAWGWADVGNFVPT